MEKGKKQPESGAMPAGENVQTGSNEMPVIKLPKAEEIKKTLAEQIKKFNHLNKLVTNRDVFIAKKEELNKFLTSLQNEKRGESLDTEVCKLTLNEPYRNDGLKITNAFVIEKTIRFVISEIEEKLKILEAEILEAV